MTMPSPSCPAARRAGPSVRRRVANADRKLQEIVSRPRVIAEVWHTGNTVDSNSATRAAMR